MGKMEKINRFNYEEFAISYLDGSLDTVDTAELLIFLEQNPDLKDEVSGLSSILLKTDQDIQYDFKDLLIRPADLDAANLNAENYNHYFIAAHEGDLTAKGLKTVEAFLVNHPELTKDYELYALARLKSSASIRFPNPGRLKKPLLAGMKQFFYLSAAAAGILILMTLYLRIGSPKTDTIADKTGGKEITGEKPADKKTATSEGNTSKTASGKTPEKAAQNEKATWPVPENVNSKSPAPSERNTNNINRIPSRQILNNTPEPFNTGSRNFYSDLFDEITKSQEPMLASLEPESTVTPEDSAFNLKTGRRMGNLFRNGAQIASQVNQSFSGWMLADLGIEGINMLTDNKLKLQRIVNADGSTGKVRLTENGYGYSISRKPN